MKRALTSSFLVAAFALATVGVEREAAAQDQPWLTDRRFTEGPGILVGDFELHPGISAEFGYDRNFFRRADDEAPLDALRLRVTPSFAIATLGPQRRPGGAQPDVAFRAGVSATYNEFIPLSGTSADQTLLQNNRNVGGAADLSLRFFPGRVFFGELTLNGSRIFQPSQQGIDLGFVRWVTSGAAEVGWAPRGGVFEARLGYRFDGTFFEAEPAQSLSNMANTITAKGRWRFLPRTSLSFDGSVGFIDYFAPNTSGQTVQKTSSIPVRARVGFNGLITDWLSVLAMGGWGASFYKLPAGVTPTASQDFDSFIAQAEAKFFLTPNPKADPSKATMSISTLTLGFVRDFYDSYISTFYERNRGYLTLSYFFGGKVFLLLDGGVAGLTYPGSPTLGGNVQNPWTDIQVDVTAFAEYRFKDWLGANLTGRYSTNISDRFVTDITGKNDRLQWQTVEAHLGLRLMF